MTESCPPLAFVGGAVHGGRGGAPAEAILVSDSRVVTVGATADVLAGAPQGTRIVQLDGRAVMPAFTDSHTHFHRAAMLRRHFLDFDSLAPASISDVLAAVRQRVADR